MRASDQSRVRLRESHLEGSGVLYLDDPATYLNSCDIAVQTDSWVQHLGGDLGVNGGATTRYNVLLTDGSDADDDNRYIAHGVAFLCAVTGRISAGSSTDWEFYGCVDADGNVVPSGGETPLGGPRGVEAPDTGTRLEASPAGPEGLKATPSLSRDGLPEVILPMESSPDLQPVEPVAPVPPWLGGKVAGRSFGVSRDRPARFNLTTLEPLLEDLHSRLSGVVIECLPWPDFLRRHDGPGTLFYLDPPYWGCEEDYGKAVFERADHARLAEALGRLRGRFILSLNDVPAIRETFAGFATEAVETTYTINHGPAQPSRREPIITGP